MTPKGLKAHKTLKELKTSLFTGSGVNHGRAGRDFPFNVLTGGTAVLTSPKLK